MNSEVWCSQITASVWFTGDRNAGVDDDDVSITSDEERVLINEIQDEDTDDWKDELTGQLEVYRSVLLPCLYPVKYLSENVRVTMI